MKITPIRIGLFLLLGALLLAACGGGAPASNGDSAAAGDETRGKDLFAGTCSACHGPDAKGVAGLGKDLTTSEFAKAKTDPDLLAFLKVGRSTSDPLNTTGVEMPPKGGNPALTDQDLADIVAYVRALQK